MSDACLQDDALTMPTKASRVLARLSRLSFGQSNVFAYVTSLVGFVRLTVSALCGAGWECEKSQTLSSCGHSSFSIDALP